MKRRPFPTLEDLAVVGALYACLGALYLLAFLGDELLVVGL
jgi:hypothetical protein